MTDYVVDTSVVMEHLVTGPFTTYADIFFAQTRAVSRLLIPEFCLIECTNVIWKHVRFEGLPISDALRMLKDLQAMQFIRAPSKRIMRHALEIGLRHRLAVYDSVYIALADRMALSLVTIDVPQSRAAAAEGITVISLTTFM